MTQPTDHYVLGGADLEMRTIAELLQRHAPGRVHGGEHRWGVRASDLEPTLRLLDQHGARLITVELPWDLPWQPAELVEVDHHGPRAGADAPSSLRQVFDLLGLPAAAWTRELALVEANDRGYIEALQALAATPEEIARIRAADRAAQGIRADEEQQALAALATLEQQHGLTIAHLPHARTAALVDRLHPALGGPGYQQLLVLSPNETNYYGPGPAIHALNLAYPGGWYGGALPERGYWGIARALEAARVVQVLQLRSN